ncbi:TRAP transporter large permease [Pararhodobacter aggregans]|uniref:TRAP transporter large permease protein n=1 Tax=Pararhodobacter aggregans TaxID=404875 RepID=A0A2T7UU76_9RHOB|nr:TRAP transporter large permease [Pararhodobacter aggregans]PTX03019.1 tripartite ATP-independent transporter DctM subunit [Pararhodobacter aggregans]PVE48222.1 C4-dicarboxylate ABC transporter [Pararhodobacter aggregans]
MDNTTIGLLAVGILLLLMALRVPIGFALAAVAFGGTWAVRGPRPAASILQNLPYEFTAHWTLTAVPMFLLMGALAGNSGLTTDLFRALRLMFGRLRGGIAIATNFAGAGFAAACGSSMATTATLGRIAVPEMLAAGYSPALATGVASAVGTLGAIIPPSIMMIVYAIFAEVSAGKMLIAGILPGLLTAAAYALVINLAVRVRPGMAPRLTPEALPRAETRRILWRTWPLPVLSLGVIGGIYSGLVSPTEAGALGAGLAFLVAAMRRSLSADVIRRSLFETVSTTASILFIATGALLFTRFLALTGLPYEIAGLIDQMGTDPLVIVLGASIVYLIFGCFLDPLGVLLLTLPVVLPIFHAADIDPIWIGVIIVKYLEIGMLTPPLGLNVFVMKGVVGDRVPLGTIFRGVSLFLVAEVFVMALLIGFPQIVTFLPDLM